MAAPAYTTDLVDITLAESTTGWTALGGGASGLGVGADFSMQGTFCVDKQVTASEKGQIYNNGATITPAANTHFFVWVFLATAGLANTLVNRGLGIVIGTGTAAYNTFHVEGSDTYGAVGRVGKCYPIRYVTTSSGAVPYRTLTGSPGANPQYFGATTNITGSVKGANLGVDAIRRGTGVFVTAGEVAIPGTFAGMASTNDNNTNRWGVLTFIAGNTYELQGRFVVGQTSAGTPTQAYFSASDQSILIIDTPHSLSDFTQIVVDHASTVFNLTNCIFTGVGTNNPGRLVYNNASTASTLTGCSFATFGISTLRAGVTVNGCTWRNSGDITQNGATIDASTFARTRIVSNNPSLITNSDFTGDATKHGIELTTPGTYTLNGLQFSGFGATGTTSAAIYNNSGGAVTLNISGGGSTPTIRNGTGATTTVVASANLSFTGLKADSEVRAYVGTDPATATEIGGIENSGTSFSFSQSQAGNDGYVHIIHVEYQPIFLPLTYSSQDVSIPIQQVVDRQYSRGTVFTPS